MYNILRLGCEHFSRIYVKISFLRGPKHGIYAAESISANVTSWCSLNDTQIFTSVILYVNIIFIAKWLFGGNSEILYCSDNFARRQKLWKPENIFQQTRQYFYCENIYMYDVISWLRHSYAKDPLSVTRLLSFIESNDNHAYQ